MMEPIEPNSPNGRAIRRVAGWLLWELGKGSHEVVLGTPGEVMHSGHKIRVVQSQNAAWYRKFANNPDFQNCRGIGKKRMKRPRTFIVRSQTAAALERIIAGDFAGVMAERLVRFINAERAAKRNKRTARREQNGVNEFELFGF